MLPIKIKENKDKSAQDGNPVSVFTFNNLPKTFPLTIGNFLRRMLLTSIEGYAPIVAKIKDNQGLVKTQFSALDGILETTPYLLINCKKIIISEKNENVPNETGNGVTWIKLQVENNENNERKLKAGDFQTEENFEIKNPDLYIATLSPNSHIEISLALRKAIGYQSEEENEWYVPIKEEGNIIIDSNHSPVKGGDVNFEIKTFPTGLEKEEEELSIKISTNGSITPRKALLKVLEFTQKIKDNIVNELSD